MSNANNAASSMTTSTSGSNQMKTKSSTRTISSHATNDSSNASSTNAFYRSVVGSYEQKQRELVLENGDLKVQVRTMEVENRKLMNSLMEMEVSSFVCHVVIHEKYLKTTNVLDDINLHRFRY